MYCTKCGRELPSNGSCACGAQFPPVQSAAAQAENGHGQGAAGQAPASGYIPQSPGFIPPPVPPPFTGAIPHAPYMGANGGEPPAVSVLRREGSSVLMLALCLVQSISLVLGFAGELSSGGYSFRVGYMAGVVLGTIPGVLFCVGLWMFYRACKSPEQKMLSSSGLALSKISVMIMLIILAAAAFLVGVLLMVTPAAFTTAFAGTPASALGVIGGGVLAMVGVILLICAAVCILLLVFSVKTFHALLGVARTGFYNGGISMVVIVLLFISVAGNFISLFSRQNFMEILTSLLSGANALLLALMLNKLRSALSRLPLHPVNIGPTGFHQ